MTDRLDRFRTHIQRKLADDTSRVRELAQWCEMWPQRAGEVEKERIGLHASIPDLRAVLDYLSDFEKLEAEQ